jgi:hypothetical protein
MSVCQCGSERLEKVENMIRCGSCRRVFVMPERLTMEEASAAFKRAYQTSLPKPVPIPEPEPAFMQVQLSLW